MHLKRCVKEVIVGIEKMRDSGMFPRVYGDLLAAAVQLS
jgi:hypothetical protein